MPRTSESASFLYKGALFFRPFLIPSHHPLFISYLTIRSGFLKLQRDLHADMGC